MNAETEAAVDEPPARPRLLIVTPVHNEAHNLTALVDCLAASTVKPDRWVLVDDGSTDGSLEMARSLDVPFPVTFVQRENSGGLIGGSAFGAWQFGVDEALTDADFDAIMKLDADVSLPPEYLERHLGHLSRCSGAGLTGGVLVEPGRREQNLHVPGPVKLYSIAGYRALSILPRAVGFDVMDEVAIKSAGLDVRVDKGSTFTLRRDIGASQGRVHGRMRNGRVCRWTGYDPFYFLLHAARYLFRKPYGIGGLAVVAGYLRAGPSPYSYDLRRSHAMEQRLKLRTASRNPIAWIRRVYGQTG